MRNVTKAQHLMCFFYEVINYDSLLHHIVLNTTYNRLNTSQNSPRLKLRFCSYPTDPERFSLTGFMLWSVFVPVAIRYMCKFYFMTMHWKNVFPSSEQFRRIKHHYSTFRDRHASDFIAKFPWDSWDINVIGQLLWNNCFLIILPDRITKLT